MASHIQPSLSVQYQVKNVRDTSDAIQYLSDHRKDGAEFGERVVHDQFHSDVALWIASARGRCGMTQSALAKSLKTSQSVVARLESRAYRGHSLTLLERIAKVTSSSFVVEVTPRGPVFRARRGRR